MSAEIHPGLFPPIPPSLTLAAPKLPREGGSLTSVKNLVRNSPLRLRASAPLRQKRIAKEPDKHRSHAADMARHRRAPLIPNQTRTLSGAKFKTQKSLPRPSPRGAGLLGRGLGLLPI